MREDNVMMLYTYISVFYHLETQGLLLLVAKCQADCFQGEAVLCCFELILHD